MGLDEQPYGYGFPSKLPAQTVEMPPTWMMLLALAGLGGALLFWVCLPLPRIRGVQPDTNERI
jgi:hypothetical protein